MIRAAAEHEFMAHGFAGARMQRIADRAGINKALLHYYFRNKDSLFEEVFLHKAGDFFSNATIIWAGPATFAQKTDAFVASYFAFLTRNPDLPAFVLQSMEMNARTMRKLNFDMPRHFEVAFRAAAARGEVGNVSPRQIFVSMIGMCVLPFLAKAMLLEVMQLTQAGYRRFLVERVAHVQAAVRQLVQAPPKTKRALS